MSVSVILNVVLALSMPYISLKIHGDLSTAYRFNVLTSISVIAMSIVIFIDIAITDIEVSTLKRYAVERSPCITSISVIAMSIVIFIVGQRLKINLKIPEYMGLLV